MAFYVERINDPIEIVAVVSTDFISFLSYPLNENPIKRGKCNELSRNKSTMIKLVHQWKPYLTIGMDITSPGTAVLTILVHKEKIQAKYLLIC